MLTQPLYKRFNTNQEIENFTNTKIVDNRGIYVPCHPDMTFEDVEKICTIILKYNE